MKTSDASRAEVIRTILLKMFWKKITVKTMVSSIQYNRNPNINEHNNNVINMYTTRVNINTSSYFDSPVNWEFLY